MAERVLIVDDDPVQRRLLENMAGKAGYETVAVDGGDAAVRLMLAAEGPPFHCVVLDLVMPAHGGIDNIVTAMRAGAADFVVKPVGAERLAVSLRNAMATRALEGEIARLKHRR